ncbi:MAG: hypothetical protein KDA45_06605 [Planctomycetales bacterium]|nr:hypothetical protein [Planctomycetales bacterium]
MIVRQGDVRCAWLGPSGRGLGWLQQRIAVHRFREPTAPGAERRVALVHASPRLDVTALDFVCRAGVDRVVLACGERMAYPAAEVDWMMHNAAEVPWVLATDNWWDGARRTGIGPREHWILPWHAWWDGWTDWLSGRGGRWLSPWGASAAEVVPADELLFLCGRQTGFATGEMRGLIVANCRQTGEAWQLAAQSVGASAEVVSAERFRRLSPGQGSRGQGRADARGVGRQPLRWVLWDDTCLQTSAACGPIAEDSSGQQQVFFSSLRGWQAAAVGIAAVTMPRDECWQEAATAQEFIVKPNSGQALMRILLSIPT